MSTYTSTPLKGADKSEAPYEYTVESCGFTPTPHAVHFFVQLDDGNELEERLRHEQRERNKQRGSPATSDEPHHVADVSPPWLDGERELGFFSSRVGYGHLTQNRDLTRYYDQHIQLYDDTGKGSNGIANDASKTKVVIEKREHGLHYIDPNGQPQPFTWHPGRNGQHYEGTLLKIQTSFVQTPWEALERAEWLLTQLLGQKPDYDLLMDTFRFAQPEVHIRYHRDLLNAAVKTISDTSELVATEGGQVSAEGETRKGRWDIWGFESRDLDRLGFKKGDLADGIDKEYVKTYMKQNAPRDPANPLAHPKLEVKIHGAFHVSRWSAVIERANDICLTFADWSGISDSDVVADEYFRGLSSGACAYARPEGYREALEDYYSSEGLREAVIGRIWSERTDAYHDVLLALAFTVEQDPYGNGGATYEELEEKTGFSYSTLTKRVPDLIEDGLLTSISDGVKLFSFANSKVLNGVRDAFERTGKTAKRLVNGLRERAHAREEDRERQNGSDVSTNDDRPRDKDGYLILSETTATFDDLARWHRKQRVTDDDIKYRPPDRR